MSELIKLKLMLVKNQNTKLKMKVRDFCSEHNISSAQYSGEEKIEGSLDLNGLTSIPEGFNPTVGGSLYLSGLTAPVRDPGTDLIFFQDGKYVLADGIFTEIVRKIGNVFVVRKLNSDKEFYLVTDLKFVHAHGNTIEKANADFRLKLESYLLKHEPITMDTVITVEKYHAITGACDLGINGWVEDNIPTKIRDDVVKNGILVKDLLPILEKTGAYGLGRIKELLQGQ
jgi:hypothetical protein